jgi:hypothetical protein
MVNLLKQLVKNSIKKAGGQSTPRSTLSVWHTHPVPPFTEEEEDMLPSRNDGRRGISSA